MISALIFFFFFLSLSLLASKSLSLSRGTRLETADTRATCTIYLRLVRLNP